MCVCVRARMRTVPFNIAAVVTAVCITVFPTHCTYRKHADRKHLLNTAHTHTRFGPGASNGLSEGADDDGLRDALAEADTAAVATCMG